jgi:hypothetical protein
VPPSDTFVPSLANSRVTSIALWKREDIRRLRELAESGESWKAIALKLRRSESAIRNKAAMQGISLRASGRRALASDPNILVPVPGK